jgi:hypothetical protein
MKNDFLKIFHGFAWVMIVGLIFSVSCIHADDEDDDDDDRGKGHGSQLDSAVSLRVPPWVENAKWKAECGSCHTLFHPSLLPERSWQKLMASLGQHFGDDASLDQTTRAEITDFLVAHSSDRGETRRATQLHQSIPKSETPLKITDTSFFQRKHDEISARVWKRPGIGKASNCVACHGTAAEKGIFDEDLVRIPKGK